MRRFIGENRRGICNALRLWLIIFIVTLFLKFPQLYQYLFLNFQKLYQYVQPQLIFSFLYLLIITSVIGACVYVFYHFYIDFIKAIWNFLKTDEIVHYLVIASVPIFIFHYYWDITNQSITISSTIRSDVISQLSGFYATLFTAIAVISGLVAFATWRGIKNIHNQHKKLNAFIQKLTPLKDEQELSEWVQEKIDKTSGDIKSPTSFISSEEDKLKVKNIEKIINAKDKADCWLRLCCAHQLVNSPDISFENCIAAEKIYNSIEVLGTIFADKNLLLTNTHLKGQLYWYWYKFRRNEFKRDYEKDPNNRGNNWFSGWCKYIKDHANNNGMQLLRDSYKMYKRVDNLFKSTSFQNNNSKDLDETYGNIALPLIEMAMIDLSDFSETNSPVERIQKRLMEADHYLNKRKDDDFNTFWDRARIRYYMTLDNPQKSPEILELIEKTIDNLYSKKDRVFFIQELKDEYSREINWFEKTHGFPGCREALDSIIKRAKLSKIFF